jgi:hypothetical protein
MSIYFNEHENPIPTDVMALFDEQPKSTPALMVVGVGGCYFTFYKNDEIKIGGAWVNLSTGDLRFPSVEEE